MLDSQHHLCGTKTKLILAGYSQGAHVTGDAYLKALSKPVIGNLIVGVVLFSDPLYNHLDPSDFRTNQQIQNQEVLHHNGSLTVIGPFHDGSPRHFPASTIGHVLSYCLINDFICQGLGGNPFSHQHSAYPANGYPADAAKWLAAQSLPPVLAAPAGVVLSNTKGFGEAHPIEIYFGGDPTGLVTKIHWTNWGQPTAYGTGIAEYLWPGLIVADGKDEAAQVVVSHLGTCEGKRSYNSLQWYFPEEGEYYDPARASSFCPALKLPAEPQPKKLVCADAQLASGATATQVWAFGVSCAIASAMIARSPAARYAVTGGRWLDGRYRCGGSGVGGGALPSLFECATTYEEQSVLFFVS